MLFSSVTFLFFFLPVTVILYLLPSRAWRNLWFLSVSLLFYLWSEGASILILLGSILGNYLFGLRLGAMDAASAQSRKFVLGCGIFFNLALLCFFKYSNFIVSNLNCALHWGGFGALPAPSVHAPVGISFYTFHAVSYLVDGYRGAAGFQSNPGRLAIYLAPFPRILAGPITPYRVAAGQLASRVLTGGAFLYGTERFITGLAKKVLIANPLGGVADAAFAVPVQHLDAVCAWVGIACYTLQIYFDFSGYSDMAVGIGKMFGFDFPENFNFPYISQSMREFWQRWHISLSAWFRDYLYIPLGGNRCSAWRTRFNLFAVFLLCGLWHGPSWNFVVWGAWHGFFLSLERTRFGDLLKSAYRPVRHLYLLFAVMTGWVFFRAESFGFALSCLKALAGFGGGQGAGPYLATLWNAETLLTACVASVLSLPVSVPARRFLTASRAMSFVYAACMGLLFVMTVMALAGGTHKSFIYFKF